MIFERKFNSNCLYKLFEVLNKFIFLRRQTSSAMDFSPTLGILCDTTKQINITYETTNNLYVLNFACSNGNSGDQVFGG